MKGLIKHISPQFLDYLTGGIGAGIIVEIFMIGDLTHFHYISIILFVIASIFLGRASGYLRELEFIYHDLTSFDNALDLMLKRPGRKKLKTILFLLLVGAVISIALGFYFLAEGESQKKSKQDELNNEIIKTIDNLNQMNEKNSQEIGTIYNELELTNEKMDSIIEILKTE